MAQNSRRIRKLKLKKLPKGKFRWAVDIKRSARKVRHSQGTLVEIADLRILLENTGRGEFRIDTEPNWRRADVVVRIWLTDKADLTLIKLCHADKIYKMFEIIPLDEQPQETDQPHESA